MEDSATITDSSLLSKLESSSDLSSLHHLFSSYLQPFSDILKKPKKHSKSATPEAETSFLSRSLAKRFLSLLIKALSLLPKRLNETPKIDPTYASELFETYKLCIRCLESISSQLTCKPHSVQLQRIRLIRCYENWGRYEDAQVEGFLVLEFIGNMSGKRSGRVVPELGKENGDKDVAMLILEVVVTLVKCVSHNQTKDKEDYRRVLSMVDEIQPWLRVIDEDAYEKLHRMLVTYLSKCTLFLVREFASFDGCLTHRFCVVTFSEYSKSSINDQMEKFGHRICSSIFSQMGGPFLCDVDIVTSVLDAMAHECKNGTEKSLVDFLELADYCAIKSRNAPVEFCGAVAAHFDKLAGGFSQVNLSPADLITRLYATSLSVSDLNSYSSGGNAKIPNAGKDFSIREVLLNIEDQLQRLTTTLGSLAFQCKISAEELGLSVTGEFKKPAPESHLLFEVENEASISAHTVNTYVHLYFTALKFLCGALSEMINSKHKDILCVLEDISFPLKLPIIQEAFRQFSLVFLAYRACEREGDVYEHMRIVLAVAAAAFTLSYTTQENIKESTKFLRHLISAEWVQVNRLKLLFAPLHNVGIVLYRTKRLKEATKSVKLCCQAAWNCVIHFCKTSASGTDEFCSDRSEDAIASLVTEACAKSSFLLDILYQRGSNKRSSILTECLGNWLIGQSLFNKIPSPVTLIKQWVKMECKQRKDPELGERVPTIYSLMSSSLKMSKETCGILLEQELQAYKEMSSYNPKLCKIMQVTITNILLEEIYSTKDGCLQKSRILIEKGRESRACGFEGLNDCIKYLSEAILLMVSYLSDYKSKDSSDPVCHQLAEAYCLRALCTQEAEPNSKHFIQDIGNALELWSIQEHSQSVEQTHDSLTLLYHVTDLLLLKGYMEDHSQIYEMIVKFFTWKNIPLQKCLAILWQSRSLSHSYCASPVSDAFIMTLSKYCNLSTSMEFWRSCMERSKSLEVGFRQSLSVISTLSSSDSYTHGHDTQINEVKQAASDLVNSVPMSSHSMFLAAHLYYDLGERMIARGLMIQALFYAKEAHRLRKKLLQKNYIYSVEQKRDTVGANGEALQKRTYGIQTFHMHSSVATTVWSYDKGSIGSEDCILTPWNILRCYLESTLQIGTIQENVGNGSEAEALLQWGKNISLFHDLPIFVVGFSSALGKLYCKQQLWHLAEKELDSAKCILADSCSSIYCLKCRLVLEVTVDQQLGDLFQSQFSSISSNKHLDAPSKAENLYRSAADKLKVSEWKNCVSNLQESSTRNTVFCDGFVNVGNGVDISSNCANHPEEKQGIIQPKVTRKSKKTANSLPHDRRMSSRITRSSKQRSESVQTISKPSERKQLHACGCEVTCVYDEINCWHCLPIEIMKSLSLKSIIHMKWECIRRRLLLRLLDGIGKCLGARGKLQIAHEVYLEGISVLVSRSTFCRLNFSISSAFLTEIIEKKVFGDVFAIEHASILYNMCWFLLKSLRGKETRNDGCDMPLIPIPTIVSGLKLSFILCREVPVLFQKVSRLLAVLYALSSSNKAFSRLCSSNVLCETQWAVYFHQASLGTHLNHQLFSLTGKQKDQKTMDIDGSGLHSSSLGFPRLAPESLSDLEGFILSFFRGLPSVTIICISMFGEEFASLLEELLPYNHPAHAWIMLSRLSSDTVPVIVVLPIDSILAGSSGDDEESSPSYKKCCVKPWYCPWGHTIIDEVAPLFKRILEDNYLSSAYTLEDTKKARSSWWSQRRMLDQLLGDLLRDVEDLWFGRWKQLLLGELSDCKYLDSVQKKLGNDLKLKCKVDVHESILKVILGGGGHASQQEECLSELTLNKGCYIGGRECHNDQSSGASSSKQHIIKTLSSVSELISNTIHKIGEEDFAADREPVILVPDFDIQMLPWENLPILRNQEVYRMPSVASISSTFARCCQYQQHDGKDPAGFPMIDPLDAYYLLNPGGDLSSTEAEFVNWFKDQNLEGTAGTPPTVDELSMALRNHELFMYFGHGSGVQYISGDEIQKLDRCAATLLMGCSSGSLSLNGSYTPKGAPLSYLFAGSPVIVANLWEVTDKDIDRFGKAVLDAWITTRSSSSVDCPQCTEISDQLKEMQIDDDDKRNGKKRTSSVEGNTCTLGCKHRPKIASFMGEARQACTLPFLIGASPVCYGVPTGIRKKKDL